LGRDLRAPETVLSVAAEGDRHMPFNQPYRDFVPGDLVYGLERPRAEYLKRRFHGGYVIEQYYVLNNDTWKTAAPRELLQGFKLALGQHPAWKEIEGKELTNANIRMKDKGGLWWATRNGIHVNFILDQLIMESVVHKSHPGGHGTRDMEESAEHRAVTGSELRWIYRHAWIPEVRECIQFWYDKQPTCPPWETYQVSDATKVTDWTTEPKAEVKDGASLWGAYSPRLKGLEHTVPAYGSYAANISDNRRRGYS
jgi:hypothetical protein